jgi:broad specificity phosphatase PhoE
MKTTIYLVRHGEVHNPDRVVYGRLQGFRLSGNGRRQAHVLGKYLSSRNIRAVYASPLERTRETARIVSSYHKNIPVEFDELLLEVHSPPFEGKPFQEAEDIRWNFYQEKYYVLGQERAQDIWKRINAVFKKIITKHKGKEVVVVSHSDPIIISLVQLLGRPLRDSEIEGKQPVPPANGFMLVFDDFGAVEVSKLDLPRT